MKKPRTKDDVVVKLRAHIDAGDTLKALIEHPAFSGFFNAERAGIIAEMVNAQVSEDTIRRDAAIRLAMLDKFRTHLTNVVTTAERAKKALDKLEDEKNAG